MCTAAVGMAAAGKVEAGKVVADKVVVGTPDRAVADGDGVGQLPVDRFSAALI